jgi:hypothetical protein
MKTKKINLPDWEKLISVQTIFQARFPESILVGGTSAALHAKHRVSLDADHVIPNLSGRFAEILSQLEKEVGWKTSRIEPPVLILGNFQGVRTGIRQLIRKKPLQTTQIRGLTVPTTAEILRIKAYLIIKRNVTRDFIDFIALFDYLGTEKAVKALTPLDDLYPQEEGESILRQLSLQLAEPKPWDLTQTDLRHYKSLKAPYSDWKEIRKRSLAAGSQILRSLLG